MIYADNAATTKLDIDAFEAMKPYLMEEYGNASQAYSFSRPVKKALQDARKIIAESINAHPSEIIFTSGGTESDNWAIKGIMLSKKPRAVVTSEFEHHAILRACAAIEKLGCPVTYIHPSKAGFITPNMLKNAITDKAKLASIMLVNNEIGTLQPIKKLCQVAHDMGVVFHTDAVQAVGHVPIDVKDLGIDLLSASAHKFNGPKGIGFLYVCEGTKIIPYADGGVQEFGMRAGTENIASIVGMAVALKKSVQEIDAAQKYLQLLEKVILDALAAAKITFKRNGAAPQIPGNLNLSFKGANGEMLLHRLDLMGIMVSTGSACDSKNTQISHVLKAIDADDDYAAGTIRISLSKDNTDEEARTIAAALVKILKSKLNRK